eukprot:gene26744-29371_t
MYVKPHLKISIITVVRNGEQFIGQTIASVAQQNYDNIEYIVIDGASTDGTLNVIKEQSDHITHWISEPDKGIADAFNKGLALATGDYLLFLNADDALAANDVVTQLVDLIHVHSEPEILYGNCDLLNRETEQVMSHTAIEFMPQRMRYGHMIPQPSMFTRRTYFKKYGNFDTTFRIAMDYEWLLRGGLRERVVHVPILVTRVHDGGISTQARDAVVDEILRAYFGARSAAKALLKLSKFQSDLQKLGQSHALPSSYHRIALPAEIFSALAQLSAGVCWNRPSAAISGY